MLLVKCLTVVVFGFVIPRPFRVAFVYANLGLILQYLQAQHLHPQSLQFWPPSPKSASIDHENMPAQGPIFREKIMYLFPGKTCPTCNIYKPNTFTLKSSKTWTPKPKTANIDPENMPAQGPVFREQIQVSISRKSAS